MAYRDQKSIKPFREQLKERLERLDKFLTYKNQRFCRKVLREIIQSIKV